MSAPVIEDEPILTPEAEPTLCGEQPDESSSAEFALVKKALYSAGFLWMSSTALRLWLILALYANCDTKKKVEMTQDEFATRFRVGKRTILGAMKELQSYGWLVRDGERGEGISFQLRNPPQSLPAEVVAKLRKRIEESRKLINQRESDLKRDQQRND